MKNVLSRDDIDRAKSLVSEGKIDEAMAIIRCDRKVFDTALAEITAAGAGGQANVIAFDVAVLAVQFAGLQIVDRPVVKPPREVLRKYLIPKPKIRPCTDRIVSFSRTGRSERASLSYAITSVASLRFGQATSLLYGVTRKGNCFKYLDGYMLEKGPILARLTYPIHTPALVTVHPYRVLCRRPGETWDRGLLSEHQTVGYVLWQIARAYRRIFADPERWGVWGHVLGDLVFERIRYYEKVRTSDVPELNGRSFIELDIGS